MKNYKRNGVGVFIMALICEVYAGMLYASLDL